MSGLESLEVHCFGELAGVLADEPDGLRFDYQVGWIRAGRPPLSQSLPADGGYAPEVVRAFFSGLLPEGEPRKLLARDVGVSERNDFALLKAVGGDCPGAISLYVPGTAPTEPGHGEDVEWLDEPQLGRLVRELPTRPMLAGPDGDIRLSLAGAQDKLPVVVDDSGRVGVTSGRTPSTHILKTPIARLEGTIANEAFCLLLGQALGVATVDATPGRADGSEYLLVRRHDRERSADGVVRLHQEDFCQALGVPPERKYQAEGGPSIEECFALVGRATSVPARGTLELLDVVGLNFLVANHDAHGKNFSLLYRPTSVELAPFYDILSTFVYRRHGLSRKMAMKLGGEYRSEYVRERHFDALFESVGLGPGPSRSRLRRLAAEASSAAHAVLDQLDRDGWRDPTLDRIVGLIEKRSARLIEGMAGRARG